MDFIPDITEQLEEGPKNLYMSAEDQTLEYIISSEEWDYFFLRDEQTESTVYNYKVVINDTKAE